jgi:hypothetical protein
VVKYSSYYGKSVSCTGSHHICVWNMWCGEKMMAIFNFHDRIKQEYLAIRVMHVQKKTLWYIFLRAYAPSLIVLQWYNYTQ